MRWGCCTSPGTAAPPSWSSAHPGAAARRRPGQLPAQIDLPWELVAPRAEDRTWDLLSAGRNWLALLPRLPAGPLPRSPFVGLWPYRGEEAALFFGRGEDVWDLYRFAT